jgi:hypothetical protein
LSSSFLSRLSSKAFQTPVPFTSSVCPTAYISESKAVLMVQKMNIFGPVLVRHESAVETVLGTELSP